MLSLLSFFKHVQYIYFWKLKGAGEMDRFAGTRGIQKGESRRS